MHSLVFLMLSLVTSPHPPAITCAAVGRLQIEAAIGRRIDVAERDDSAMASICSYTAGDAAVTISVTQLQERLDLPAELQTLKKAFPAANLRELEGLGERAFCLEIAGAGTQLHLVSRNGEYVLISVLGLRDIHNGFNAATQIARAILR